MNAMLKRIGIICAAMIPVAIVGVLVMKPSNDGVTNPAPAPSTSTTTTPTPSAQTTTAPAPSGARTGEEPTTVGAAAVVEPAIASLTYVNGMYTVIGSYNTPEGLQSIEVTLEIADDKVKNAIVVPQAKSGTASGMWQEKFIVNFGSQVVGKSLNDLKLTKVSGSSLTPIGFNNAVGVIQDQAEV